MFFCHAQAEELRRPGFFAKTGVLYLQAQEEGLSYAIESASPKRLKKAETKGFDFEWDFGFYVGLGYRIPHDCWECLLQFTSLQTHADAHKYAEGHHVLFPVWHTPFSASSAFADQARAHWRLHFGLIDLLLNKPISVTQTLTLTPKAGLRWGAVRQKYNIEYRGGSFPRDKEILIRMKNKFWGIGPTLGSGLDFALGSGWSLFGDAAFSLLYGEFYLHQDGDTLGGKSKLLGNHCIYRSLAPILDGSAGLRWQRPFSGSLKRLTLQLSWDQLLLFSQNQLLRFVSDTNPGTMICNQGDLSIGGVQLRAAFDF